jgi:predicted phosphodiesterase
VHVVCEYGNHGRLGRKGDMPAADNVDRMAYAIAAGGCAHLKNVTWQQSADWYQVAKIGNYKLLVVHGDEMPGFNGILRKVNTWSTFIDFNDCIMGHFHTPSNFTMANGGRIWVTGSPESDNQYAKSFIAAVGKPSQRVMFVDPDKGRVTCEYVCWLD